MEYKRSDRLIYLTINVSMVTFEQVDGVMNIINTNDTPKLHHGLAGDTRGVFLDMTADQCLTSVPAIAIQS